MSGKKEVPGVVDRTRSQTVGGVSVVPSQEVVKPLSSLTKGRPAAARTRARTVGALTKPPVQLVETSVVSVPPKPPARPSAAALAEYGVGVSLGSQNPQQVESVRVLAPLKPLEPPKGRPSDPAAPPKQPGPFIHPTRARSVTISGAPATGSVPPPVAPRPSKKVLARYSVGSSSDTPPPPIAPRPYAARPSDATSAPIDSSQISPVRLAGLFPMPPQTEPVASSGGAASVPGKGNGKN